MNKKLFREQGKSVLRSYSNEEKSSIEQALHNHLFFSHAWKYANVIAVTVSFNQEWDTYTIIKKAWEQSKSVVVPKCDPKTKQMIFYSLTGFDQLESVYFGLKEPSPHKTKPVNKEVIDVVIVPGLLFDRNGYRIGYGGGFYDRFLKEFKGKSLSILSNEQIIDEIPTEPFDIPVNLLITEDGLNNLKKI
ncbi:5-formyltetrahydrofolate cyclo-ligase [Halobacillus seohaensis]|uniref:5-formyltetrahydrofolate cyclo-ligase n=1 Tax=Halobacillus seohaensis TaxID=447421 RepID=A0ABW2EE85_9BACI